MTTTKQQTRRTPALLLAAPLVIVLCVFLGGEWQNPLGLFTSDNFGILEIRLWRTGLGVVVGAALAISGAACQAVLRNPLAEPYSLGVASGGGLAIALVLACGAGGLVGLLPAAGFLGALVALLAVYRLACIHGRTAPHTLILAGVACGSLCNSVLMLVVSRSSAEGMHALLWWFLGDLQVYDRMLALVAAALTLVCATALFFRSRRLNALMLGDDAAAHLGLRAERERWIVLLLAAALTACAVCVSGIIGFVGLVVPHVARGFIGADHRRLLPVCALLGAVFVCVADGIGRTIFYPVEIPVGVFTALAGAPFFLRVLRQKQREIWTG